MKRILCFLFGHEWKKYKRWRNLRDTPTPERQLRQWKRCLRCSKSEVV